MMWLPKCGCRIEHRPKSGEPYTVYCPTHAAAEEMVKTAPSSVSQTEEWHETFDRAVRLAEYIEGHSADPIPRASVEKLAVCVLWLAEHMGDLVDLVEGQT